MQMNGRRDWVILGRKIGSPDEEGNVYALDQFGNPYIAYNAFGYGNNRIAITNPLSEARAKVYNTGGRIVSAKEGKKLKDYYDSMRTQE